MLYTTKEVAANMRVTETTVRRMVKDGRIPPENYTRIGRDYRFGSQDPRCSRKSASPRPTFYHEDGLPR